MLVGEGLIYGLLNYELNIQEYSVIFSLNGGMFPFMNMNDLARKAGVSQPTVSRVVNNQPGVSPEVIARVKQAMDELGYKPQPRAPRGPGGKHPIGPGVIAMLSVSPEAMNQSDTTTAQLRGVRAAVAANGMTLVVSDAMRLSDLPRTVAEGRAKGVVLVGGHPNPEVLERIKAIPSVWLTSWQDASGEHPLVGNEIIGRMAVQYLAKRGHKRVGFFNVRNEHPALNVRAHAFQVAAQQQGMEAELFVNDGDRTEPVLGLDETERLAEPLLDRLLKSRNRPTGIFIPYDLLTAVVYRLLYRKGVKPGKDLFIVSCNNQKSILAGLDPRPATIDVGVESMGRHAVEQLLTMIRHGEKSRVQVVVEPQLVEGEV